MSEVAFLLKPLHLLIQKALQPTRNKSMYWETDLIMGWRETSIIVVVEVVVVSLLVVEWWEVVGKWMVCVLMGMRLVWVTMRVRIGIRVGMFHSLNC